MVKLKIVVKEKRLKCYKCGKSNGILKFFILNKRHKTPKPYHVKCTKK